MKYKSQSSGSNTSHLLTEHLKSDHRVVVNSEREAVARACLNEEINAVGEATSEIRNHKRTLAAFGVFAPKFEKCLIR